MYFNVLLAKQVDGLIVAPAPGDHSFIQNHIQHGACVVLVNRYLTDIQAPAVACDDEEAAFTLVDSLLVAGTAGLARSSPTKMRPQPRTV